MIQVHALGWGSRKLRPQSSSWIDVTINGSDSLLHGGPIHGCVVLSRLHYASTAIVHPAGFGRGWRSNLQGNFSARQRHPEEPEGEVSNGTSRLCLASEAESVYVYRVGSNQKENPLSG